MTLPAPMPLAFGFVTPLFAAAGVALASIPIIIHLLNRRRHKTVTWAAMQFLLAAVKKNRKRLRFEQWLLLAVRCCVLGLFGLALARPLGCDRSTLASLAGQHNGLHVLVIDNSYSMGFESARPNAKTNLDQAKLLARQFIGRMSARESVAVITASRPSKAIITEPTFDLAAAASAVDQIKQSYAGTDLPGSIRAAIDIPHHHAGSADRTLELFTDGSRSAFEGSQAIDLPSVAKEAAALFKVSHYNLGKSSAGNESIVSITPATRLVRTAFDNTFTCDPRGFGNVMPALLEWSVDDQPLPGNSTITPTVNLPPQTQPNVQFKNGGFHVVSATLRGEDNLKLDDTRSRVVDVISQLRVLIVEGQRGVGALAGSGSFLSLAFAPPIEGQTNRDRPDSYVQPELISDLEFGNKRLSDYRAIVLAGVGQISDAQADQLKAFVETGGALLIFMGEAVSSQNYNATLLPRGLTPGALLQRMSAGDGKPYLFDFNPSASLHPLLNVFRNQERSGLDTAPVFTYWKIDAARPGVERVLDYRPDDQGSRDPAITAHPLGGGRVVFVSTSANWDWTFLPAKPAYVALVHELLGGSISANDAWLNKTIGERVVIPAGLSMTGTPQLRDPQQLTVTMQPVAGSTYQSPPLERPGVYHLDTGSGIYPIAVNPPAEEADIRTLEPAAIARAMGDIPLAAHADELPAEGASLAENDYGFSMMLIVLIGLAIECILALRFGHHRN